MLLLGSPKMIFYKSDWITTSLIVFAVFVFIKGQCPADSNPKTQSGSNCYILINNPLSRKEAEDFCNSQYSNGALAQTRTDTQMSAVNNLRQQENVDALWLGVAEIYTDWKWTDKSKTDSFSAWYDGSNYMYYEKPLTCASINAAPAVNFLWTKESCGGSSAFICEISTSSPQCVQDGNKKTPFTVNNRCFLLIQDDFKSWFDSRQNCMGLGGDLAKIDTQAIYNMIKQNLTNTPWRRYWIGLRQSTFYWSTGAEATTYFWGEQQPRGEGGCIKLSYDSTNGLYKWHTELCDKPLPFICQIGPDTQSRQPIVTLIPPTTPASTTTQKTDANSLEPISTINPPGDIVASGRNSGPSAGTTAGLSVLIIVVFAILVGLVIFFWYYTRRNKLLKKRGREAAAASGEEGNGDIPHADFNSEVMNGEAGSSPATMFTTSFTSTGRASKQKVYVSAENAPPPTKVGNTSRSSSTTSLHNVDKCSPSPVNMPETNQYYENVAHSRRTLKTDSEGTSETDDASSSVGTRHKQKRLENSRKYNESELRVSKRKELGERGSRVRRSGSKVGPEIKPNYQNEDDSASSSSQLGQSLPIQLNPGGSFRRGNTLPPMETKQEERPKPKPRKQRSIVDDNSDNSNETRRTHNKRHNRHEHGHEKVSKHKPEENGLDIDVTDDVEENQNENHRRDQHLDDTPREGLSHRGRSSSRRVRVNKKSPKKHTDEDVSSPEPVEQPSDINSPKNNNVHTQQQQQNHYHVNGRDINHDYHEHMASDDEESDEHKVINHDQTLYLQTCNTFDDVSDVDADSLPDDQKLDIFV